MEGLQGLQSAMLDWRQNWAIALDCLESLRPILGQQHATGNVDPQLVQMAASLFQQVPSQGLLSLAHPTAGLDPALDLTDLQAEYMVLQEVVHTLKARVADILNIYQQAVNGLPNLQGPAQPGEEAAPLEMSTDGDVSQDADVLLVGSSQDGSHHAEFATGLPNNPQPRQQQPQLCTEEHLVLVHALWEGYCRQLEMLALVAGSLNLVTPPETLDTYICLLKLQPFVDERVEAALDMLLDRASKSKDASAQLLVAKVKEMSLS